MKLSISLVVVALTWGALLWTVLQGAHLRTSWDHVLCGPWGCGPPLPAVISCHLAWLVVLTPIALIVRRFVTPQWIQAVGLAGCMIVFAALVGLVSREAFSWWQHAPSAYRPYVAQRCLTQIAGWTDYPLVELGIVSLIWWWTPIRFRTWDTRYLLNRSSMSGDLQPIEITNDRL